jgi:hypothetical protein
MIIKVLKNESDYEQALKEAELLMDSEPGSAEESHLEVLSILIEKYEDEHFPVETKRLGALHWQPTQGFSSVEWRSRIKQGDDSEVARWFGHTPGGFDEQTRLRKYGAGFFIG